MEDGKGPGEDCGMEGMGSGVEGKTEEGGNWQHSDGGSRPLRVRGLPRALGGHGPGSCGYFRGSGTHPFLVEISPGGGRKCSVPAQRGQESF